MLIVLAHERGVGLVHIEYMSFVLHERKTEVIFFCLPCSCSSANTLVINVLRVCLRPYFYEKNYGSVHVEVWSYSPAATV